MSHVRARFILAIVAAAVLTSTSASAQVFGTFSWRMTPYCNVVTFTITQIPGGYTIDGNDNQCGAGGKLAGAGGMALINPDGTVGLEFTIVSAPSGKAVHVSASLSPATGSGPWTDSVGNSGSFDLGVPGAGSPRPLPASGVAPATITALELASGSVGASKIANGAVGAAQIATGAVGAAQIANGVVGASALGTITQRSATSSSIANLSSGSVTATCLAGEQFLSGGNDGFVLDGYHVVASRSNGSNGWTVFLFNATGAARTVTAHVYCLAP